MMLGKIVTVAALSAALTIVTGCSEKEADRENIQTEGHGHDHAETGAHAHEGEDAHPMDPMDPMAHDGHDQMGHHDDHGHNHDGHDGHDDHGAHAGEAPGMKVSEGKGTPEMKQQLGSIFQAYLPVQSALAADDAQKTRAALEGLENQVEQASQVGEGEPKASYTSALKKLQEGVNDMQQAEDIAAMREGFQKVSNQLITSMKNFGYASQFTAHITHCPMAFNNKGADWLQADKQVMNPYYGDEMLHCGSVEESI